MVSPRAAGVPVPDAFDDATKPARRGGLPPVGIVAIVVFHVVVLGTVVHLHNWLPEAVPSDGRPGRFSGQRAMSHLATMLDVGVRTVGSRANEVFLPLYITREIEGLRQKHPSVEVEVDIQWPTGAFNTAFLGGFTNTYKRVTNVIVRLSPRGIDSSAGAVLVGAHFDSSIGTVGAADDLVNIASMMEVVSCLARHSLKRQVVFNFNGAEEVNWQAAHGFITTHPWAKNIKAVLNLEAAGSGGREMVIQNGPANAWISRAYVRAVPFPHIHGVAQLLFQSGALPVGTDYQVYRDYHPSKKPLPGLDWAVIKNGHVYHTPQDDLAHVDPNHVQRLGQNMLSLVHALQASPYLDNPGDAAEESDVVYDILGVGVMSIEHTVAAAFNVLFLVLVGVVMHMESSWKDALDALLHAALPAAGCAIAAPVAVGMLFTLTGQHILWYSNEPLAYVLYPIPALAGIVWAYSRYMRRHPQLRPEVLQDRLVRGGTLLFAGLLLPMALARHTLTSFLLWVWLLPLFIGFSMSKYFALVKARFPTAQYSPTYVYVVAALPGLTVWWHFFLAIMGFFLPITARIGNEVPPNMLVGVISGLLLGLQFVIPLAAVAMVPEALVRRAARGVAMGFGLLCVTCVVLHDNPYTSERPKRIISQHVHRKWHNAEGAVAKEDTGLWVIPMDYEGLGRIQRVWPAMLGAKELDCTRGGMVYCDTPWYFPVSKMLGGSRWRPLDVKPDTPDIVLDVLARRPHHTGGRELTVRISGPPHMAAVVDQGAHAPKLQAWSLTDGIPPVRADCNCIWICHNQGVPDDWTGMSNIRDSGAQLDSIKHDRVDTALRYNFRQLHTTPLTWEFTVVVASDAPLNIAVYGHYLDAPMSQTLKDAHASIPAWASDITFSSSWASYIL